MKLLTILLTATLLLLTASAVSAQNSLPDTNDAACWQSLDALHDCAQAQQDRAMAQAERCTSYPCLLYTSPSPRDVEESRMPSSA